MASLPAICDNCGTVFSSGFAASSGGTLILEGNKSGPCPSCGGYGSVPDGTYRVVEEIIEILSAPQTTIDELMRLSLIIEKAEDQEVTVDEMKREAEDKVPALSRVFDLLPKNREEARSDIKFFLKLIMTAIPMVVASQQGPMIQVDQVINETYQNETNYYHETNTNYNISIKNTPHVKSRDIGRNDPCYCGSGIKYKKCHGRR